MGLFSGSSGWGPALIGGGIGAVGQYFANQQSQSSAREQMAFQERMSNTSHQREVQDLIKAGLNPLMSANAGASTPVGASFTAGNIGSAGVDAGTGSVASALAMRRLNQDVKESQSRVDLNQSQADVIRGGFISKELGTDARNWIKKNFMSNVNSAKKNYVTNMENNFVPGLSSYRYLKSKFNPEWGN